MRALQLLCRHLGVVVVVAAHLRLTAAAPAQFQWWYPQFGDIFTEIVNSNCSSQYAAYLAGDSIPSDDITLSAIAASDVLVEPVVNCILQYTSNFVQTNMQSAGVLLGIMPSVLSVLGSSTEETALLFVIARRPLLTLLLAAGSPVVVALRPFEYREPVGILREREVRFQSLGFFVGRRALVLVIEYLLVIVAVANVAHISYQLGMGVIIVFSPHSTFLPALWAVSGVLVHIIGAVCLRSRLAVTAREETTTAAWSRELLKSEFTLSRRKSILATTRPENKRFLVLSWFTSMTSTFHVVFGTLTFSSMLFISVRDSFGVIGRYIGSVAVCRIILMYELSGLRETVQGDFDAELPAVTRLALPGLQEAKTMSLPEPQETKAI